jgi:hypothetical protein
MRAYAFEEFLREQSEMFVWEIWQQKCEVVSAQSNDGVESGAAVEELVVLVDCGFEGGVQSYEVEQGGVFVRGEGVAGVEEQCGGHISYIIAMYSNVRLLLISSHDK